MVGDESSRNVIRCHLPDNIVNWLTVRSSGRHRMQCLGSHVVNLKKQYYRYNVLYVAMTCHSLVHVCYLRRFRIGGADHTGSLLAACFTGRVDCFFIVIYFRFPVLVVFLAC